MRVIIILFAFFVLMWWLSKPRLGNPIATGEEL